MVELRKIKLLPYTKHLPHPHPQIVKSRWVKTNVKVQFYTFRRYWGRVSQPWQGRGNKTEKKGTLVKPTCKDMDINYRNT